MRKTMMGLMLVAWLVPAAARAAEEGPPRDPEARKTWIAEKRAEALKRREEFLKLSPQERDRIRTERRAERVERRGARGAEEKSPQPMDIHGPLPLPVRVEGAGGPPVGEACSGEAACSLRLTPAAGQAAVITSAWSATKIECDGVSSSTPRNGAPVEPWWRCEQRFTIEGPGAGYVGFLTSK
jgi:hypothetical protein